MSNDPIRYVHLSDFHVGKDGWAQQRLFEMIIERVQNLKTQGFVPDLIFITGDIANQGIKSEFKTFREEFYLPLLEVLGGVTWHGKIFGVPGNHDVARPSHDVLNQAAAVSAGSHFFDPTNEGKRARDQVIPRFKQYKQLTPGNVSSADWVASPAGTFAETFEIRGQRIGIVGINTAWLSMSDNDRGKLTPGIPLIESALKKIKDCDLHIVLGHHPLHWMLEEEACRLRALFGCHKVIYLHGHMHRPEGRREDGAGEDFLIFQAGAAFQARDDEPWKNGLMLGEADCQQGELRLSPRYWNPDNYDWPVETGRFPEKLRVPGSDWWSWPLPGASPRQVAQAPAWQPPQGWEVLEAIDLQAYRRDITPDEAARFFDGAEPDWSLAQCPTLPRRAVVGSLADRVVGYRGLERPQVTLLIGPGGEGKSMALRQAVVALLERVPNLRVLWRRDDGSGLTADQLMALPPGEAPWLVATDAADLVAKPLHRAVQSLNGAGRSDVRFLLAARDSDWRAGGASRLDWRPHADYHEQPLSGLTLDDAGLITTSWASFGEAGLGEAAGADGATLAKRLYDAAVADASIGEGALLGGMLAVRLGEGLRGHVKSLMERLDATKIPGGGSLYTAFAYLAVMHAEGLAFLSRPVLAEALGCDAASLQKHVVFPLGSEAGGGGGTLLLTRHRRIARAAVEIMRDEYGEDIDGRYVELATAAMVARPKGWIAEFARWEYDLPEHFMKHQPELAIRIGIALLEKDPSNSRLAVNLARLYRESDNPGAGAEVLRGFGFPVGENRGFWVEWGACAGKAGDPALNAWLTGWSVADQPAVPRLENDQAKQSLASVGVAFRDLHRWHHDQAFIEAHGAVGQLGLMLRLDLEARTFLERYLREAREAGVTDTDLHGALQRLHRGLTKAWELCSQSATPSPIACPILRQ